MKNDYISAEMTVLKIVSVLMIVFGALGILLYALGLAAVVGLTLATSGVFSASRDLFGMGLLLVGAIVELVTGALGSKAAKRPDRAGKALIVWGVLTLLLTLAFFFLLLGPTLVLLDKLTSFSEGLPINPILDAAICLLLAGVFFLIYSIRKKTLLELIHTNGSIGLDLRFLPDQELHLLLRYLRAFLSSLERNEEEEKAEAETAPEE